MENAVCFICSDEDSVYKNSSADKKNGKEKIKFQGYIILISQDMQRGRNLHESFTDHSGKNGI